MHLERMVRLVSEDEPDVVALQEVPLWGLPSLAGWSGMRSFAAPTKRALLGPLARGLQRLDAKRVRSPLTGQANALLVSRRLDGSDPCEVPITAPGRRRELRICQLLQVTAGGRPVLIANVHATTGDEAAARGELARVGELVSETEACAVLGDFNVRGEGLPGFSPPLHGIDQILVRGLELVEGPMPWPDDRRALGRCLLSDHAPVEAVVAWS
jgi:endonuclease/exonuclease/phosphatase family metal-dependent hydrolase